MGTGSGCIAITLKLQRPNWDLSAIDLSSNALKIAKINSDNLLKPDERINLLESDWFSNLGSLKFDIIVANPPYIPLEEKANMMPDVLNYEPHLALFVQKPYDFYKSFLEKSLSYIEENGKVYFETHPDWVFKIKEIGEQYGFKTEIRKDLSNKNRMVKLIL